jgi:hypothetical protein
MGEKSERKGIPIMFRFLFTLRDRLSLFSRKPSTFGDTLQCLSLLMLAFSFLKSELSFDKRRSLTGRTFHYHTSEEVFLASVSVF